MPISYTQIYTQKQRKAFKFSNQHDQNFAGKWHTINMPFVA